MDVEKISPSDEDYATKYRICDYGGGILAELVTNAEGYELWTIDVEETV